MPDDSIRLNAELSGWLFKMQIGMDGCIGDMIQTLSGLDEGKYGENVRKHRIGIIGLTLDNLDEVVFGAEYRATTYSFLNSIRLLINFLDRLIASQRVARDKIKLTRPISGIDDLKSYVESHINDEILKVASQHSLSNPQKLALFIGVDDFARTACLEYFQLRRMLEHRMGIPEKELVLPVKHPALLINDEEVMNLPQLLQKGQKMEVGVLDQEIRLTANSPIVLSPVNVYDLVFTMRDVIGPEIFRAHIDGPAEAPSCEAV